jgi:hypothetical protein
VPHVSDRARIRAVLTTSQEIGRLHARSRDVPGPDAEPSLAPEEWLVELIERAINGVELPDYAGVPDSRASGFGRAVEHGRPRQRGAAFPSTAGAFASTPLASSMAVEKRSGVFTTKYGH